MDIGLAFTFAFNDDDKVKKLLIGAIVGLVPIVNFAALGYLVQLIRNVQGDLEYPLPEWDDFGGYFVDGFKIIVGLFVYSIPILLFACVFGLAIAGVENMINNPSDAEAVLGILSICFVCIAIAFGLLPYLFMPAMLIRYAETEAISSLLQVGELWALIQQDFGGYIIVLLVGLLASIVIAPLGSIACVVGVFLTQWWAYLIMGHIIGQWAINSAGGTYY